MLVVDTADGDGSIIYGGHNELMVSSHDGKSRVFDTGNPVGINHEDAMARCAERTGGLGFMGFPTNVAVDVVCGIGAYVTTVACPATSDSAESAATGEAGAAGEAGPANE